MLTSSESELWHRSLCDVAHKLEIVDPGENVVIGGLPMAEEELSEAASKTSAVLRLLSDIYIHDFDRDTKKMALALGFSEQSAQILTMFTEDITHEVFARSDLIYSDKQWQLVELNIGTTVGGIFYASLPRLSGQSQAYDTLKFWAKYSAEYFNFDGNIVFIEDDAHLEHMKLSLHVMVDELKQFVPCKDISVIGHKDVHWDGKSLYTAEGAKIDVVYRFFDERDVRDRYDEYQPVMQAIASGAVRCPMSPKYNVLSNKGILALLWEKALAGSLSSEDTTLVRSFIPYTFWLTSESYDAVLAQKESLVIKPIDGNCGFDVYVGPDMSEQEWKDVVTEVMNKLHPKSYVAQRYVAPPLMNVTLAHPDGGLSNELQKIIWGIFVFGNKNLGGFIRAKNNAGSNVINHANGANIGPLPCCQWMTHPTD
ncbi:circularly permuted type 2 ATP-grasp protein [Erwinia papayae]|uniref:Circularly permuted type 2 ATP-grasp protein n=1 Tax=Erwinia papayae TaxID=206499 RepID=A0ABV3N2B8_9GAMM